MPLIAITPCSSLLDYEASVRLAGGERWVLDPTIDRADTVVHAADGLLLTGGNDVGPHLYGAAAHPSFLAAEAGRDAYEIALVSQALEANLPIFAICRGLQVLNVARGGTLVQDIPTERPSATPHQLAAPLHQTDALAHAILVASDSLLISVLGERLTDTDRPQVNSRHHQAVKTLGEGLRTTATAPDGIVEAVEAPGNCFCIGVQWHPENFYRTGEFLPLFDAFVRACQRPSE
jgi:putative glutamine amidotransferase